MNEAIIASLMQQDQNAEEEQILREVMKISALEHQKQIGALNLDHLKKKNNKQLNAVVASGKNADLSDISNTFGSTKVGELPPIQKKGATVLPPPRLTKRMQQKMDEDDQDAIEERKFLEIINSSTSAAAAHDASDANQQTTKVNQINNN